MIKEQGAKLQELEAKLVQKNRSEEVEKGVIETKLATIENLFKEMQVKLSSFSQEAGSGQTEQLGLGQWPLLPLAHRSGCLLYPSTFTTPLDGGARSVRNSPETNGRTITIDISRSRFEKRSAEQIKDTMTSIMQAQIETKECKIQQARILPGGIIELSMESNTEYEIAWNNPR